MTQDIKDDTELIKECVAAVKINTEDILARVKSIRDRSAAANTHNRVGEWIEDIAVLSTYAETAYQETVVDPTEPPAYLEGETTEAEAGANAKNWNDANFNTRIPQKIVPVNLIEKGLIQQHIYHDTETLVEGKPSTYCTLSFDGIEDLQEEIMHVASLIRRDEVFIASSRARRKLIGHAEIAMLDAGLRSINGSTKPDFVQDVIARGAEPSEVQADINLPPLSVGLGCAVASYNHQCLFKLLQCGANPNSTVLAGNLIGVQSPSPGRIILSALAYAASLANEAAVWALCAAGASTNPPLTQVWCPNCQGGDDSSVCGTPLLSALTVSSRPSREELLRRVRITRFLLCNGADARQVGCEMLSSSHNLHSPLSQLVVNWSPCDKSLALELAVRLMNAGAKGDFQYSPAWPPNKHDPFVVAASFGNNELLKLLSETSLASRTMSVPWAITHAAKNNEWACISVLVRQEYMKTPCLHMLVDEYMSPCGSVGLSWEQFTQAVNILLHAGADPTLPILFPYVGQKFFVQSEQITEIISAIKLASKVKTNLPRKPVISLLKSRLK
jgi:hypothetical protein